MTYGFHYLSMLPYHLPFSRFGRGSFVLLRTLHADHATEATKLAALLSYPHAWYSHNRLGRRIQAQKISFQVTVAIQYGHPPVGSAS